jgi:Mg2+ and Co2+ transporter CorA
MALRQIEPKYLDWIRGISKKNTNEQLGELKDIFDKLNDSILYAKGNDTEVISNITDARKKLLYSYLLYNDSKINSPDKDWTKTDKIFKILTKNMDMINSYEQQNILSKQQKSVDMISTLGVIFLPLALITGYYGMNFGSMGSPVGKTGPFSWKYGQSWVLFLFVVSTIITLFVIQYHR